MKKAIITIGLLLTLTSWTVAATVNYIIYNLEVVNVTESRVDLKIMGEVNTYGYDR
jgi:hypothetical protein